ncbi:hypothetical protein SprV_0301225800 [Sparganum proliferum]
MYLAEMAAEQCRVSGLQLQGLSLTTRSVFILCDISTASHRSFVLPSFCRTISSLRNLPHLGSRMTDKLRSDRFFLPEIQTDLKAWTRRACYPVARRIVERFYCQLTTSLPTAGDPAKWTGNFLLILLGIFSALKLDLACSANRLMFGASVRLPGQINSPPPRCAVGDPTDLLHPLRQFTRVLSLVLLSLRVLLRVSLGDVPPVQRSLRPSFYVISLGMKAFRLQRRTFGGVVGLDRIKVSVPSIPPDEPCILRPTATSLPTL